MEQLWRKKLVDRFINYIKIYSTSDAESESTPSTERQWDIANYIKNELVQIGLSDVSIDKNAYVMAFLPSNLDKEVPTIGFISHFDTSPDFSGENVNPQIWENYDGKDLLLNSKTGFTLSPDFFPDLKQYKGQTLITTDGTTLLGADDKAGCAEIVTAMEYLLNHPEIKHGKISVCFTPDEEIGRGANLLDIQKFGAEWAYTMDGSEIGELEFENFNAAGAKISFFGKSVHPGYAKDTMINAGNLAVEFASALPDDEVPEQTTGYEGFFHLTSFKGGVTEAELRYIIRDHDADQFEARKNLLHEIAKEIQERYKDKVVEVDIKDQYYNMRKFVEEKFISVEIAQKALENLDVTPNIKAIRGGTDGAQLSYRGLPCPNIFAGGHNFHGPYEYVPVESMEKATEVVVKIAELVSEL